MRITSLDLSLTATGYAIGGTANPREQLGTIQTKDLRGCKRLATIRKRIIGLADGSDLVVVENYAFARPNQAHQVGELGGVVRLTLHDLGFEWVLMAPAALKKLATGKGNASKESVLVEAVRRLDYQGSDNNEADALWLLEAALNRYGITDPRVPKGHLVALEKVEWPRITNADNGGAR